MVSIVYNNNTALKQNKNGWKEIANIKHKT